jgi:thymidylate kinase
VKYKYLESVDKLKNTRKIYIIDANQSIEEVFLEVSRILDEKLPFKIN